MTQSHLVPGSLVVSLLTLAFAATSPEDGPWEGWATTTQFGSGDGPWGDDPTKQVYITALNNESLNRMGAAVPWRYYFKWYGSKAAEAATVFDSITGKSDAKACFLMQPVMYGPSNLTGSTDGVPVSCAGAGCIDINDDGIAASYQDGALRRTFPSYLIVPFEGCGGDCKPVPDGPGPDCMNSCSVGSDFLPAVQGQFANTTSASCAAMRVLCGGQPSLTTGTACTWPWDDSVRTNFLKLSQPIGCSAETAWCQQAGKLGTHVNWCSGQNMHFDIGMDIPFYQRGGSNAKTTTDAANIVVRYKRVSCAVRGTFDPVDRCKRDAVDCGLHGHCAPETGVCICDAGYSGPSCATAAACQAVTCPSGSKCEASTGSCVVFVPPSLDGCTASHWSCQDPSLVSALTSWCTSLLGKQPLPLCVDSCAVAGDMSGCAACILQVYGLGSSCSWASGGSTATTLPAPRTTTAAPAPSTSVPVTPVGTVTLRTTSTIIPASTTPITATITTATTRGSSTTTAKSAATTTTTMTRATTTTTSRGAVITTVTSRSAVTTSRTTRALSTSSSPSSTLSSTPASGGASPTVGGCSSSCWLCQDSTIVSAMAAWCAGVLNQQPRLSCLVECAATSTMSACAACVLQLYGYSTSCTWLCGGATTSGSTATVAVTVSTTSTTTTATRVATTLGASTSSNAASRSSSANPPAVPQENVDMPEQVRLCSNAQYAPVNDYWSYGQIASAFFEFGVRPWNFPSPADPTQHVEDCVAALTIVAGECNPGQKPQLGCSASLSGASGVFQTDFLRTLAGYPVERTMSLCASAFGAGYMVAPFFADADGTLACTLSYAGNAPGAFYTCAGAPAFVNNYTSCPDPAAQPGTTYPNFIGRFCHKSFSMRWSACDPRSGCCSLWRRQPGPGALPAVLPRQGRRSRGSHGRQPPLHLRRCGQGPLKRGG